ncbi:hypothetical protein [Nostoc sp.]|uniref:hypothetical protein n=1 Tax=Nostoc sp. TaxID=1180 RepID=UPI002FFB8958
MTVGMITNYPGLILFLEISWSRIEMKNAIAFKSIFSERDVCDKGLTTNKLLLLVGWTSCPPLATGARVAIGVNLSQNPFQTSFPARGWKCT